MKYQAIALVRSASESQASSSESLSKQLKDISSYAKAGGLEIKAILSNRISGKYGVNITKEFLSLCNRNPNIRFLIATRPDRITRNIAHYRTLKDELNRLGIEIMFSDFGGNR